MFQTTNQLLVSQTIDGSWCFHGRTELLLVAKHSYVVAKHGNQRHLRSFDVYSPQKHFQYFSCIVRRWTCPKTGDKPDLWPFQIKDIGVSLHPSYFPARPVKLSFIQKTGIQTWNCPCFPILSAWQNKLSRRRFADRPRAWHASRCEWKSRGGSHTFKKWTVAVNKKQRTICIILYIYNDV